MFLEFIWTVLGKIVFFTGAIGTKNAYPKPLSKEEEEAIDKLFIDPEETGSKKRVKNQAEKLEVSKVALNLKKIESSAVSHLHHSRLSLSLYHTIPSGSPAYKCLCCLENPGSCQITHSPMKYAPKLGPLCET